MAEKSTENTFHQDAPTADLTLPVLADYVISAYASVGAPKLVVDHLTKNKAKFNELLCRMGEDVAAFAERNPASSRSPYLALAAFPSIHAVLHYRIANALRQFETTHAVTLSKHALCNRGRERSGVEIHPDAVIGRRFVVDHGFGTVIGETTEIGDDCYVLNSVILGARGIANNPHGKRHPTLGSRVQIGAFACVLGPINVGDDVVIGPHAVVTRDVPCSSRVHIVTQMQIEVKKSDDSSSSRSRISGYSLGHDALTLYGSDISLIGATYANDHHQILEEAIVLDMDPCVIRFALPRAKRSDARNLVLNMQHCRLVLAINLSQGGA